MQTKLSGGGDRKNVLVVRTDRIGDVVLSTPVFASIRKARPDWRISVLVRPLLAELLEDHPHIDEVITLGTNNKPSFLSTRKLPSTLRRRKFDIAVHLYSDFWVSLAVWRAGIRERIGPASKVARIFYGKAIVQHRSKGRLHEADYNLALLKPLGIAPVRRPFIAVSGKNPAKALFKPDGKNVGVFPGMGGSARNWKPRQYAKLVDSLRSDSVNVILMCGPGEEGLLEEVEKSLTSRKPMRYVGRKLKELAVVIGNLDCFVAPSTGPLHIASGVGTPAVGIYCPIRVCLPARWGPIGDNDASFAPQVPACEQCAKERCGHFDCMELLDVEPVANAVRERLQS